MFCCLGLSAQKAVHLSRPAIGLEAPPGAALESVTAGAVAVLQPVFAGYATPWELETLFLRRNQTLPQETLGTEPLTTWTGQSCSTPGAGALNYGDVGVYLRGAGCGFAAPAAAWLVGTLIL